MNETRLIDVYADDDEPVIYPRTLPPSRQERHQRRVKIVASCVLVGLLVLILLGLAFYPVLAATVSRIARRSSGVSGDLGYLYSIPDVSRPSPMSPSSVAVSDGGLLYVADPAAHKVRVFDVTGEQLYTFGKLKDGKKTHLEAPAQVKVAGSEVLVSDRQLHGLYRFDLEGNYLGRFIRTDTDWSPLGVSVDEQGDTYVTDVGSPKEHRVQVFDPSGLEIREFGSTAEVTDPKAHPGSFFYPYAVLPRGDELFVADSNNGRIQVFGRDGSFRYLIASGGVPRGMAFDAAGHLLVVDTLNSRIDVFTASGRQLGTLGAQGDFTYPNDIAVDQTGRIFVADRGSNRVQVWGPSELSGVTAASAAPQVHWPWLVLSLPLLGMLPVIIKWPLQTPGTQS